jgi:predicted MFS family arabinose efflux permease
VPPAEGGGMEIYMKNSVLNIYKYLFFLIYGSMIYVYIYNLVDKGLSISNGRMNLIMLVVGIVVLGTTSKMLKLSKRTSFVYIFDMVRYWRIL